VLKVLTSLAARTASRVAAAACLCILIVLSLAPAGVMVRTPAPKVFEHFLAYAGTGILAAFGFAQAGRQAVLATVALTAFAGILEYAQRFSPGRESGWDTFFASGIGAVFGVAVVVFACRRLARSQQADALNR
jgi:VanZ family protein